MRFRLFALFLIAPVVAACGSDDEPNSSASASEPVRELKAQPSQTGQLTRLRSLPGVQLPKVTILKEAENTAPGLILSNPRPAKPGQRMGPMVFDEQGRVRWFLRLPANRTSVNLQVQKFRGKPVLTWAQRPPIRGPEDVYNGVWRTSYMVIADRNYRVMKRVRVLGVPQGLNALHEFHITPKDTAFVIGFRNIRRNLRSVGGPRDGRVTEGLIQEIDLKTNKVLLDWRSLNHISLRESTIPYKAGPPYDYIHLNSVSEDSDGHLLVSARHTNAIYKLHRRTGKVIWRLNGKRSDFRMGKGAAFKYQHDAQRVGDGTVQLFDNALAEFDQKAPESRVLRLKVDTAAKRATVAKTFTHPKKLKSWSQANARELPNGNVFVGWGSNEYFSEFSPDGKLLWDAKFPTAAFQSYRGFKGEWSGKPQGKPALAASHSRSTTVVFASFNGSTDVARWRVKGGRSASSLKEIGVADWAHLETRISVPGTPAVVQVEALDGAGKVLGTSPAIKPKS